LRGGRDLLHSIAMLVVPAWQAHPAFQDLAGFYREHASRMEPWDGPAALAFSDGRYVGAALDRNGLRPMRYSVTSAGLVVAGSEVGLFDLDDQSVQGKGRLGPGQMLAVDLDEHTLLDADGIKRHLLECCPKRNTRLVSVPTASVPIEPIPNEHLQA